MRVADRSRTDSCTKSPVDLRHSVRPVHTHRVPMLEVPEQGALPLSKADPPIHTHLYRVKCIQRVNSRHCTDSLTFIQKWVVH